MKKILALTLALIMCACVFVGCGKKDTLVIGYTLYAPMNYEENGELIGFDLTAVPKNEMETMKNVMLKYVDSCEIRGI